MARSDDRSRVSRSTRAPRVVETRPRDALRRGARGRRASDRPAPRRGGGRSSHQGGFASMPARARGTRAASFGPLETAPVHRVAEANALHPEPSRARRPPRSTPHPPLPDPRLLRPPPRSCSRHLPARARPPPYPSPCSFPAPRGSATVPSSSWNPADSLRARRRTAWPPSSANPSVRRSDTAFVSIPKSPPRRASRWSPRVSSPDACRPTPGWRGSPPSSSTSFTNDRSTPTSLSRSRPTFAPPFAPNFDSSSCPPRWDRWAPRWRPCSARRKRRQKSRRRRFS